MKRATPLPFLLLVAVALLALFVHPGTVSVPPGEEINSGDVAWMLTASALVLLMTPGLSFFYGGMVTSRTSSRRCSRAWSRWGSSAWSGWSVGFSLAFGDDMGGVIGNPLTFFMFDGVGEATNAGVVRRRSRCWSSRCSSSSSRSSRRP